MNINNDGVVIMYMKDGVLYPVALNEQEYNLLQTIAGVFNPLKVVFDSPVGKATNVLEGKR